MEEFAEQVIAGVQKAVDKSVPWAKPSAQAQAWWTLQCAEAVHKAKRLRSEWKAHPNNEKWDTYLKAVDQKGKIISKAKRSFFRREMHSVSSAQQLLIKIAKWARLRS